MATLLMYALWLVGGGHCLTSALVLRDRGRLVRALVNGRRGPLEGVAYLEATASWHRGSILYRLTTPFVNVCWLVSQPQT